MSLLVTLSTTGALGGVVSGVPGITSTSLFPEASKPSAVISLVVSTASAGMVTLPELGSSFTPAGNSPCTSH